MYFMTTSYRIATQTTVQIRDLRAFERESGWVGRVVEQVPEEVEPRRQAVSWHLDGGLQ